MKIINGHDYYDSCIGMHANDADDVIFVRKSIDKEFYNLDLPNDFNRIKIGKDNYELSDDDENISIQRDYSFYYESYNRNLVYILFAGKLYLGYKIRKNMEDQYIWNSDIMNNLVHEVLQKKYKNQNIQVQFNLGYQPKYDTFASNFLNENDASIAVIHAPITLYKSGKRLYKYAATFDCSHLKFYDFQVCLDTYTAYQELSMWLNNKASPEKPMIKVSNDILIKKHGFDKFSFRKSKQG